MFNRNDPERKIRQVKGWRRLTAFLCAFMLLFSSCGLNAFAQTIYSDPVTVPAQNTEAPEETPAPAEEEAPAETPTTTEPTTPAADTKPAETETAKSGCGSMIGGGLIVLVTVLGSAWIAKRR